MPELPDVTVYRERLEALLVGQVLEDLRLRSTFLLRTVEPPIGQLHGKTLRAVERLGKRLVFGFDDELFLVLHLMIAGRLRFYPREKKLGSRIDLAAFDFASGTLVLTEAGSKKRASLHLVRGRQALAQFDRGGLEVQGATAAQFAARLRAENRTLKRALCDPTLFAGIGNAYSDEILHTARISPYASSGRLSAEQVDALYEALRSVLTDAVDRSVGQKAAELKGEKRSGLRVHARTGLPCPVCGDTVREVSFATKSFQYCPGCQTGGKPLADRRLSRLVR